MPRTLLAPSLSLPHCLNARHRLTCSWNSVGSFYADNAVPYGGHIRPAFALVRGLILSAQGNGLLSCWIGVLPTDSGAGTASGSCCCCWHLFGDIVIDIKRALFHPQFNSMLSVQVVKAWPSASVAHISNTTNSARLPFLFLSFCLPLSVFLSLSLSLKWPFLLSVWLCSRIEIGCSVSGCGSLDSLWHYQRVCISIWFRVKFTHDL